MSEPASYPEGVRQVERVETHISWVFLTDRFVWKLKKPVRFAFLNYSTPRRRRLHAQREVKLGRRLAPDVYLGVLPVTLDAAGRLKLGGRGRVVEHVVQMRRLPQELMLDEMLRQGKVAPEQLQRLAAVLVEFYRGAPRSRAIDRCASPAKIGRNVQDNLHVLFERWGAAEAPRATPHPNPPPQGGRELLLDAPQGEREGGGTGGLSTRDPAEQLLASEGPEPDPGVALRKVRAAQLQLLALRPQLFRDRIRQRRICEGHGDLRVEHVCMLPTPVVFDPVEFSKPLRSVDPVDELAFLAMECDYLGAPEAGEYVLRQYLALAQDDAPDALAAFYKSYRACVRAKVELLREAQLEQNNLEPGDRVSSSGRAAVPPSELAESPAEHRRRAWRYLDLAAGYADGFYRPRFLITMGLMGSGKSTLAMALAERLGLEVLRTDAIRRELAGGGDRQAAYGQGIYSPEFTRRVYATLLERAERWLTQGVSVVFDGTFLRRDDRERALELARRASAQPLWIHCVCPLPVALERLGVRLQAGRDLSDGRPELYELQRRDLEVPGEDEPVVHLGTTAAAERVAAKAIRLLRARA